MGKITMTEQAAASTPATNRVVLYPKSGGKLYHKDDTATELEIVTVPSASGGMTITPLAAGTMLNFALEDEWVSGTLIDADFGSATTVSDDVVGMDMDFNANVTMTTDKDVIVHQIKLPALSQTAANTTVITGINLPTAGALVQSSGAGTITWTGVNLQLPNTTQTTGTVNSYGIKITGGTVTSGTQYGIDIGNATTGLNFSGTYTGNVIDFSSATIAPTGSNGPCFIRAGTYASPIDYSADEDQSGMIRIYSTTSAGGTSYDRGIFSCCTTTGTKNVHSVAGLVEIRAQSGAGPTSCHAGQFIAHMNDATATLGVTTTNWVGMAGIWAKVTSNVGSVTNASSTVAPIWLDSKMNGTVSGASYMAWITPTPKVDAIFGLNSETSSDIADQLFYFDASCNDTLPVVTSGCNVSGAGANEAYLRVLLDSTQYGIPLIAI